MLFYAFIHCVTVEHAIEHYVGTITITSLENNHPVYYLPCPAQVPIYNFKCFTCAPPLTALPTPPQ